jgi:predicted Zn-dependent protease
MANIGAMTLLLAGLCACAINPVTGQSELMLLSEQDERRMGLQAEESVVAEYGNYADPALQRYLQGVALPLARLSHRPTLDWQFQIMDSPVVNAFAAPGGYIFVTRGLLAAVNDEAELAGVLAHEIGHVTARHSARNYSKSLLAGLGLQLGTAFAGSYGEVLGPLLEVGTGLLFLKYSRDDERQADALAVEYASKGGYDTNRMADFFVTLQRQETLSGGSGGGGLPEWFSTHPSPVDREAAVRAQTAAWRGKLPGQSFRINRDAYLDRIDGIVYGDDPRRGFREGDAFYLPQEQVRFRVPAQWAFEREGQQVRMSLPQQAGVVLFAFAKGGADQQAQAFLAGVKAQLLQSTEQSINGLKVRRLVSSVADGAKRVRIVSHFFQKGDMVFTFHGLTGEADFARQLATLEQPAQSFAVLTDPAKLNRQPQRLVVRRVGKVSTLEELLRAEKIDAQLWPRIAWMNELRLTDSLAIGQRVKIVK